MTSLSALAHYLIDLLTEEGAGVANVFCFRSGSTSLTQEKSMSPLRRPENPERSG